MRKVGSGGFGLLLAGALALAGCQAPLEREALVFGSDSDAGPVPPPPPPPPPLAPAPRGPVAPEAAPPAAPVPAPPPPTAPPTAPSPSPSRLRDIGAVPPPPPPPPLAPGSPSSTVLVPAATPVPPSRLTPSRVIPFHEVPFHPVPDLGPQVVPFSPWTSVSDVPSPTYPYPSVPTVLPPAPSAAPAPYASFTPSAPCDPCTPPTMPICPGSRMGQADPFDPLVGCITERPHSGAYVGLGLSFLPNVGLSAEAGGVFHWDRFANYSWELQGTWQFIDDKTFVDNGDPAADDWFAVRAGLKVSTSPTSRRHMTYRAGAVWFKANGEPNWVQDPGTYMGAYVAAGFETDLTCRVTVGPSLTFMGVWHTDTWRFNLVPTLNWTVSIWLGEGWAGGPWTASGWPPGELYLDGVLALSPGFGGGGAFGQVFSRDRLAVHSVELEGVFQPLSDALFSDGDGDFAQVRGGYKASFLPCARLHPTLRVGGTWFRSTAETKFLGDPGDYVGGYLGAGLEFDLGSRITTGPELSAALVTQEKDFAIEILPRLSWHFILKL